MNGTTEDRRRMLGSLLHIDQPLDSILSAVAGLPWDSDEELVTLKAEHVVRVLERFLSGEFTHGDLERWANAIEGRDDIALEPAVAESLQEIIFDLANPSIQGAATTDSAREWVSRLSRRAV